ncbi:hypothetical protein L1887_40463 [Cichorium endivia]|nr:hypothetical protein L1887_40463 [Cichorium endivia]
MRRSWWNPLSEKIDAIDELTRQFNAVDRAVRRRRKTGRFPGGNVGFVTFQSAASAQIAAQTVHYPIPAYCTTSMAQEPRDIIWSNIDDLSNNDRRVRQVVVSIFIVAVLVFYIPPLVFLASFVFAGRDRESTCPGWIACWTRTSGLRALVQNNLPSLVVIGFNALLPLVLEYSSYLQGLKARSLVEYSLLKKYYLFLMVSVVFIFLIATTAWGVLAGARRESDARHRQVCSQLAQGALLLAVLRDPAGHSAAAVAAAAAAHAHLTRFYRLLLTRTPREFAELNAPPTLAMGNVYPQALLIFTLCILYSIVSPLIVVFGAVYFGIAYVVNKYKLLYVFYKPYESQGQAWPISASRCIWALVLFHVFQFSLFSVRKQLLMSTLMLPLIVFTFWFAQHLQTTFGPLTEHVNLSSVVEVLKEVEPDPATAGLAQNGPPSMARADEVTTDTAIPRPTTASRLVRGYYPGVLNTGRRRYGHPAITGILPELWLPIPKHRMDEGRDDVTAPDDLEGQTALASGTTALGAPARVRVESGTGVQSAARIRARALSKAEPLILSLRKRKRQPTLALDPQPGLGIVSSTSRYRCARRLVRRRGGAAGLVVKRCDWRGTQWPVRGGSGQEARCVKVRAQIRMVRTSIRKKASTFHRAASLARPGRPRSGVPTSKTHYRD